MRVRELGFMIEKRVSLQGRKKRAEGPRPNQRHGRGPEPGSAAWGRRREKRHRSLRRGLRFAGWLMLSGLAVWGAPVVSREVGSVIRQWFAIQAVTVQGLDRVTRQEILDRLSLKENATLFSVHPQELADRLAAHPWIKTVEIRRVPFHELQVTVAERKPAAVVRTASGGLLTDDEGHVLSKVGGGDEPTLPLLTGIDSKGLLDGDPAARRATKAGVDLANLVAQTLGGRVEVDVGNPANLVASVRGVRFQFGRSPVDEQWERFRRIRPALRSVTFDEDGHGPSEIDLRYSGRVIVRERG